LEKARSAVIGGSGHEHFIKNVQQKQLLPFYSLSILSFVSNMAAGIQEELSPVEASETSKRIMPQLEQALTHALAALPLTREGCPCHNALEHARFT
jgi:hypothetical protein